MTEPLKRTGMKSSPEDAAHYRRFHDHALATLRKGIPREELLAELTGKGVPEQTAHRILVAVEQELALANGQKPKPGRLWKTLAFAATVWGLFGAYVVWQMTRDGTFHWNYLIVGGVIVLILSARVVGRLLLKQPDITDLPPPR